MFTFLIGGHRAREETSRSKRITFLRETQGRGGGGDIWRSNGISDVQYGYNNFILSCRNKLNI